ncbi:hypothetical protein FDECE_1932 [Fusarium decemcellulare]|nr:hypothetical protein FDECE_1932 [Fusarium decemcellulare]
MLIFTILTQVVAAVTALSTGSASGSASKRAEDVPVNWGVLAFPGIDLVDVFGPLEVLYFVAGNRHLNVKIITPTEDSIIVTPPMKNPHNSTFSPEIVGRATFDDELDLDVLLVPGGAAARDPSLTYVDDYVKKMFPKVKYFLTVCTGAIFAARAGVLEGKRATTNKNAWDLVTAEGNNITWVAPARYVIDGNVWSSSGVSAGIDLTFAFVKEFYGEELHDRISILTEVIPRAHDDDPFTDMLGIPHQGQL